eukprot:TRINITY_DN4756_c0_g2_i3.p1 TRINITY_DN4756_c0_g2~~TRINITY_DN4756_c0_g2_i3.p1  ORF type:complete len:134 (+),score=15.61 TRINITY_DN4756_c0_g2_i3:218-619(+)
MHLYANHARIYSPTPVAGRDGCGHRQPRNPAGPFRRAMEAPWVETLQRTKRFMGTTFTTTQDAFLHIDEIVQLLGANAAFLNLPFSNKHEDYSEGEPNLTGWVMKATGALKKSPAAKMWVVFRIDLPHQPTWI